MPIYSYSAISHKGEKITGKENASSERELAQTLRQRGFILTSFEEEGVKIKKSLLKDFTGGLFGVGLVDKLVFIRNLKVMASAGVPIPRALDILSKQVKKKKFRDAILDVRERVLKGQALSQAMEAYPDIFSELVVNMVRVGEESGGLEEVLSHLAFQLEREHDVKSKIMGSLLYPAVVITAMILIGIVMLIFVVPRMASVFDELGVHLPITTRIVIGIGQFMATKWYLFFLGLGGAAFFFRWIYRKTFWGKNMAGRIVLSFPIISGIVRKTNTAFTARTLSSLIAAGVALVRSIEITSRVVGNVYFQKALQHCAERVQTGEKFSQVLKHYENLYPVVLIQMVEIGEETGQTTEVLSKLAEFYEEEVTNLTKNLTSIIEPILMLVIGAVVGFFAISMVQPMYSMLSAY